MSKPLFDADYAAVEARIICWLAGQLDALEEYYLLDAATSPEEKFARCRYRKMASDIYNVPVEEINDHPQRFIGKQAVLGCGFQAAAAKFQSMCWVMGRIKISLELATLVVEKFRQKHDRIKSYWYDVERAAQKAIASKGNIFKVRNVSFLCEQVSEIPFLLIKLPSGRKLAYPRPRLVPSPKYQGKLAIKFFGRIGQTQNWGDVDTYGGKIAENITQAVAADIMCQGAYNAENDGFPIMALIHDEALSYTGQGLTAARFVACLTDMPPWADGLPLAAEGGEVPFYKKG